MTTTYQINLTLKSRSLVPPPPPTCLFLSLGIHPVATWSLLGSIADQSPPKSFRPYPCTDPSNHHSPRRTPVPLIVSQGEKLPVASCLVPSPPPRQTTSPATITRTGHAQLLLLPFFFSHSLSHLLSALSRKLEETSSTPWLPLLAIAAARPAVQIRPGTTSPPPRRPDPAT